MLKHHLFFWALIFYSVSMEAQADATVKADGKDTPCEAFNDHLGNAFGSIKESFHESISGEGSGKSAFESATEAVSEAMMAGSQLPDCIEQLHKEATSHCSIPKEKKIKWKRRN